MVYQFSGSILAFSGVILLLIPIIENIQRHMRKARQRRKSSACPVITEDISNNISSINTAYIEEQTIA